jgi:hypothetical protein
MTARNHPLDSLKTQKLSADIHRMTSFLTQDCCRTMAFARVSPHKECQDAPTPGAIGALRVESSEIVFIKMHLSRGSCWNS